MKLTFNKVAYTILLSYILVSLYSGYILVRNRVWKEKYQKEKYRQMSELAEDDTDWNPWGEEFDNEQPVISHHEPPKILWNLEPAKDKEPGNRGNNSTGMFHIEIWGKAAIEAFNLYDIDENGFITKKKMTDTIDAISSMVDNTKMKICQRIESGQYLWEHILEGSLESRMDGVWSYGAKTVNNLKFSYRTGPGVTPEAVPKSTEHLVLVLNGRQPESVEYSISWLKSLDSLSQLKNVAVMLLGNEECNNDWIQSFMHYNGGPVKLVFLIYDSPLIDNKSFYQWPLGVATYRNFPVVDSLQLPVHIQRNYICNFLGTVYENSTRETLMKALNNTYVQNICYVKPRYKWLPQETSDSLEDYTKTLQQSDLTLNPVGKNTECYRIYEAVSYGSVPVIEDVMTAGNCGTASLSSQYPLRLLKEMEAPFIFIKDWSELTSILEKEKTLRHSDRVKRRRNILLWYESFKSKMREKFVKVLNQHFFGIKR